MFLGTISPLVDVLGEHKPIGRCFVFGISPLVDVFGDQNPLVDVLGVHKPIKRIERCFG